MYSNEILVEENGPKAVFAAAMVEIGALPPVFDRSGSIAGPSWRDLAGEWRMLLHRRRTSRAGLDTAGLPLGDGHPVIVVPGFLRSDGRTRALRRLLCRLGYDVAGWGAGINCGPTATALAAFDRLLGDSTARHGRRASLVGDSLGGVLARAIAARYPEQVRRVITVCSPFRLPTASPMAPIYNALAHWHSPDAMDWRCRLLAPPPVPTTAIYTRRDGVVAWTSCIDDTNADPLHENVEIAATHAGMLGHPEAIRIIARRLALPASDDIIVPGTAAPRR